MSLSSFFSSRLSAEVTAGVSTLERLGRVDKVSDPQSQGDDVDEAEVACGGFVVSGCQAPRVLELVEAALDAVSEGVDVVVDRGLDLSSTTHRNDRDAAIRACVFTDAVGVIAFIGDENLRVRRVGVHHEIVALVVRNFPAGDLRRDREPFGVGAEMNFGREAAFRAAKTLSLSPPFAPAA